MSCKISNLKCDVVNTRDARDVKRKTSLSSLMYGMRMICKKNPRFESSNR